MGKGARGRKGEGEGRNGRRDEREHSTTPTEFVNKYADYVTRITANITVIIMIIIIIKFVSDMQTQNDHASQRQ